MRAKEFLTNHSRTIPLIFTNTDLIESQINPFLRERYKVNPDRITSSYFPQKTQSSIKQFIKPNINESAEHREISSFITKIQNLDYKRNIKIGDTFSVLEFEIRYIFREIDVSGSTKPKTVSNIIMHQGKINYIEFDDGDRYPRLPNASYAGKPLVYAAYFKSESESRNALTMLSLAVPGGWDINIDASLSESSLNEGGWANPATQGTHITPAVVDNVFKVLNAFINNLNRHLALKQLPPVELGQPCGSTTYYKRDLVQDPTREYGDIDVNMFIPRIEGMTNNANADVFRKEIQEFCESSPDFQTSNGTNVILKLGNDHYQVDLITSYSSNKAWTTALAPEWRVKGVLCNSIYSSLGECLELSIGGGHGVQAKTQNGKLVPFRTVKDIVLTTITTNPDSWALDIAKYFGCKKISPLLKQYPGKLEEVRVADMVNSIKGIAQTLEMNDRLPPSYATASDLIKNVKGVYLNKIEKAIMSSKYDKAASPEAVKKANDTKDVLSTKGTQIGQLFDIL